MIKQPISLFPTVSRGNVTNTSLSRTACRVLTYPHDKRYTQEKLLPISGVGEVLSIAPSTGDLMNEPGGPVTCLEAQRRQALSSPLSVKCGKLQAVWTVLPKSAPEKAVL